MDPIPREERDQRGRPRDIAVAMPDSGMQSMLAMGLVFAVVVIALAFYNATTG